MKKNVLSFVVFLITPVLAVPSINFSTSVGNDFSWVVSNTARSYTMSFSNMIVDTSSSAGDSILNDFVRVCG